MSCECESETVSSVKLYVSAPPEKGKATEPATCEFMGDVQEVTIGYAPETAKLNAEYRDARKAHVAVAALVALSDSVCPMPAYSGPRYPDGANIVSADGGPIRVADTPGRNVPCPCGSGKKFKRCCKEG